MKVHQRNPVRPSFPTDIEEFADGIDEIPTWVEWNEADVEADHEVGLMEDRAMLGYLGESYQRHHIDDRTGM